MELRNYKVCSGLFSKAFGLMFHLKPKNLVFTFPSERKVPLHMMFVFFPIDVLFLDSSYHVVEVKRHLMPFRFYNPVHKARYVIELADGAIEKERIKLGEIITFYGNSGLPIV
ncbi:MAG: DUF192 domain-containing protein [Candidatus Woesearchaeota archaeon]